MKSVLVVLLVFAAPCFADAALVPNEEELTKEAPIPKNCQYVLDKDYWLCQQGEPEVPRLKPLDDYLPPVHMEKFDSSKSKAPKLTLALMQAACRAVGMKDCADYK